MLKRPKQYNKFIFSLLLFAIVIIISLLSYSFFNRFFKGTSLITINEISIKVKDYKLKKLAYQNLPQGYTDKNIISFENLDKIVDLPTLKYKGQEGFHPVRIARLLLGLLNSYIVTGEKVYLEKARLISDKYLNTAILINGAMYFPYTFDYHLHGIESELMQAPWFSGMAQGISLSAYVRFFQITGEREYIEIAERIYNSFLNFRHNENEPWIVLIDDNGYYWIEEYPIWPPSHVLNGFIFGIYGLYEYWLMKKDSESAILLKAALTTIDQYIPSFRNKGNISYYCLKHKIKNEKYHYLHIKQLENLYSISGNKYFRKMAEKFRADH